MASVNVSKAFREIDVKDIPLGTYFGKWSAYKVEFTASDNHTYTIFTDIGVRGLNCHCTVVVKEGEVIEVTS